MEVVAKIMALRKYWTYKKDGVNKIDAVNNRVPLGVILLPFSNEGGVRKRYGSKGVYIKGSEGAFWTWNPILGGLCSPPPNFAQVRF